MSDMKKNTNPAGWILLLFVTAILPSCKHEIPQPVINPGGGIDTTPVPQETLCDSDTVYFQNAILPLFVSNCAKSGCHDAATHAEGIKLNNYANIMNTGKIQAFNPNHGDILDVVSSTDPDKLMPPPGEGNPLTTDQIDMIIRWINQGALNNYCDGCDTTAVTYAKSILPLLSAKCKGCHQGVNAGGGINIVTFADAYALAQNGSLYGTVSHTGTWSPMPKGSSKLPDCDIAKIRIWVEAGSPNN